MSKEKNLFGKPSSVAQVGIRSIQDKLKSNTDDIKYIVAELSIEEDTNFSVICSRLRKHKKQVLKELALDFIEKNKDKL